MIKQLNISILSLIVFSIWSCGSNKKSERDVRREQIRNNADTKRKELDLVSGQYFGKLLSQSRDPKKVTLDLTIKEVPQEVEGEVDPIMVPTLSGYVKFSYGAIDSTTGEQISFKLSNSNYDAKTGKIDIQATNESFKELALTLKNDAQGNLEGTWLSPDLTASGEVFFSRSVTSGGQAKLTDYVSPTLAGDYNGFVNWKGQGVKQYARLTLNSNLKAPDGINLNATVRVFFGDYNSNEFLVYTYDSVQFNPIDGRISLKNSNGSEVTFVGILSEGVASGNWSNRYDGDMGAFALHKGEEPLIVSGPTVQKNGGKYEGFAYWDAENVYQHTEFTVVTRTDENNKLQINVTAKLAFGDQDSQEYMSFEFPSAKYNPWTKRLTLQRDDIDFSFDGKMQGGQIAGNWSSNFSGQMGGVDLEKSEVIAVPTTHQEIEALKGTYQGPLKNTNPNTNLPERFQMSLITSRDLSQPSGIKITGSVRFYLGDFDSLDYEEIGLEKITFNFFTRELIAVTKNTSSGIFTITGVVDYLTINGKISEDALGEIANIEVTKI